VFAFGDDSVTVPITGWVTEPAVAAAFITAFFALLASVATTVLSSFQLAAGRKLRVQSHERGVIELALRQLESKRPESRDAGLMTLDAYVDRPKVDPLLYDTAILNLDAYTSKPISRGGDS
jgi:hypothetical protein